MTVFQIKRALLWGALFICLFTTGSGSTGAANASRLATVAYVIDGDTVILENNEKIRLIGINAPEKESRGKAAEPFSLEAKLALSKLVDDVEVKVIIRKEKYDRYGRTLAYLELQDGTDIQQVLIARGYAVVIAFPPNIENIDTYLKVESQARSRNAGIWGNSQSIIDLDQPDPELTAGFHIVSGRVAGIKKSKRGLHFIIGDNLDAFIGYSAWNEYWNDQSADELVGKVIETRGWIHKRQNHYWMVVRHPSMIVPR